MRASRLRLAWALVVLMPAIAAAQDPAPASEPAPAPPSAPAGELTQAQIDALVDTYLSDPQALPPLSDAQVRQLHDAAKARQQQP